jgi:hypothetical protein
LLLSDNTHTDYIYQDSNPAPKGDKLQIYPEGIYDDFPKEGVTVTFGPDLKKKIKEAMGQDCKGKDRDACRDRVVPLLQNTDIDTHAKRFLLVAASMGVVLALVTFEVLALAVEENRLNARDEIPAVKYEYTDLGQMYDIGHSQNFAMHHKPDDKPLIITVPAAPAQPDLAESDEITLETLTQNRGEHKKGDVVYHIPASTVRRLEDLLNMLGISSVIPNCQGYDLFNPKASRIRRQNGGGNRVNTLEQCTDMVERFTANFVKSAENILELAPRLMPAQPGPGKAIGFPIQKLRAHDIYLVTGIYRTVHATMGRAKSPISAQPAAEQFHIPTLVRSTLGLTVVLHAVMAGGELALELWAPQNAVSTDIKEDEIACPRDIICIEDECGAQRDNVELEPHKAFCKKVSRVTTPPVLHC